MTFVLAAEDHASIGDGLVVIGAAAMIVGMWWVLVWGLTRRR